MLPRRGVQEQGSVAFALGIAAVAREAQVHVVGVLGEVADHAERVAAAAWVLTRDARLATGPNAA